MAFKCFSKEYLTKLFDDANYVDDYVIGEDDDKTEWRMVFTDDNGDYWAADYITTADTDKWAADYPFNNEGDHVNCKSVEKYYYVAVGYREID